MELWTIQLGKWRQAKGVLVDVTVKSGLACFAPTWDLLARYKQGDVTEDQYRTEFHALMTQSWLVHRAEWEKICSTEVITIACYCPAGRFCHRLLLVEYYQKACMYFGYPFEYKGELPIL